MISHNHYCPRPEDFLYLSGYNIWINIHISNFVKYFKCWVLLFCIVSNQHHLQKELNLGTSSNSARVAIQSCWLTYSSEIRTTPCKGISCFLHRCNKRCNLSFGTSGFCGNESERFDAHRYIAELHWTEFLSLIPLSDKNCLWRLQEIIISY